MRHFLRPLLVASLSWMIGLSALIAQGNSEITLSLQSAIQGDFQLKGLDHARIDNPKLPVLPEATIGLFTTPPSSGPEVALVLANLPGSTVEEGSYKLVPVVNEYPVILAPEKAGFMTIVQKNAFGLPEKEFYSVSGTVTLTAVSSGTIEGSLSASFVTPNGPEVLQATGTFVIRL